jgi:hypothetical protein
MWRLGLKELRNAANPSRESVADTEIGLYGTLTQGEIAQSRGSPGDGPEQESPRLTLDDLRGGQAEAGKPTAGLTNEGPEQKLTLDELRGHAAERAKEADIAMERGHTHERDGREMG